MPRLSSPSQLSRRMATDAVGPFNAPPAAPAKTGPTPKTAPLPGAIGDNLLALSKNKPTPQPATDSAPPPKPTNIFVPSTPARKK